MMDDIVERLMAKDILTSIISSAWCKTGRHPGELADLMKEAAEEITRLRERLAEADEANRRVSDENGKLRRDVKTAVMGDSAELADVKRENEKLRAALKPFADAVKDECNWKYDINVDDFRAAAAAIRESDNGDI